jgi:hypothetical protein
MSAPRAPSGPMSFALPLSVSIVMSRGAPEVPAVIA